MSVEQMKEELCNLYPGKKWKDRVDRMSDKQAIAIYYRCLENGDFTKKKEPTNKKPEQLNFDI